LFHCRASSSVIVAYIVAPNINPWKTGFSESGPKWSAIVGEPHFYAIIGRWGRRSHSSGCEDVFGFGNSQRPLKGFDNLYPLRFLQQIHRKTLKPTVYFPVVRSGHRHTAACM
jgi:hypothetical protein